MQNVTFIYTRKGDVRYWRCRETGVVYSIESNEFGEYVVRNSGVEIGKRDKRTDAMQFVEQQARLDFRSIQADSAFSA